MGGACEAATCTALGTNNHFHRLHLLRCFRRCTFLKFLLCRQSGTWQDACRSSRAFDSPYYSCDLLMEFRDHESVFREENAKCIWTLAIWAWRKILVAGIVTLALANFSSNSSNLVESKFLTLDFCPGRTDPVHSMAYQTAWGGIISSWIRLPWTLSAEKSNNVLTGIVRKSSKGNKLK